MAITAREQDVFDIAYVEALVWSSTTGEEGDPIDDLEWVRNAYSVLDLFSHEDKAKMWEDTHAFAEANEADLRAAIARDPHYDFGRAGHDFALTRNGHGAGFWDRGLGEVGERLADAARVYGAQEIDVMGDEMLGLVG